MRILLVEDDLVLVDVLTKSLTAQNYVIDSVSDGSVAWDYISDIDYDLILLDVLLPNLDGVSLCRRIRAEQDETPILILTAQHDSRARVRGLDAGADDYLVKPFDIEELMARIRALIRRSGRDLSPILQLGQLVFDPVHCSASYGGMPLTLSAKEYALLDLFFHEPHHVFSIPELLDSLWSAEEYPAEATVRSHIRRLRNKLIEAGAPPDFISNVHGRGYFLNTNGETSTSNEQTAMIDEQQLKQPNGSGSALQEQYQQFLDETWLQFQPKGLQDLEQLEQLLESSKQTQANSPQDSWLALESAQMLTHRLKGTLGLFHLTSAVRAAEHLELTLEHLIQQGQTNTALFQSLQTLTPDLRILRDVLLPRQALGRSGGRSGGPDTESNHPILWLIDNDQTFTTEITAAAESLPLELVTIPNLFIARDRIAQQTANAIGNRPADGILILLGREPMTSQELDVFDNLSVSHLSTSNSATHPPMILVVSETIDFATRLQSVRWGASCLLNKNQPASQLLQMSLELLLPHQAATQISTKALIVDDDEYWLEAMTFQLQALGFQVCTLADPHQFWLTLEATQPDILILDMKMPKVSGLELCQIIRSDRNWQTLPIIFVSALTDQNAQTSAFSVGADDYLCKPIQGEALAHRMISRLKRNQFLRQ